MLRTLFSVAPIDEKLDALARNRILTCTYKAGTLLVIAGDTCPNMYFVKSGFLRSFMLDTAGREKTIFLAPEETLISDGESLYIELHSQVNIQAVEDSEVYCIPKSLTHLANDQLLKQSDYNTMLRSSVCHLEKRMIQLFNTSSEEKYREFLLQYPNLERRMTAKMLASYLNISLRSLQAAKEKYQAKRN